VLHDLVAGHRRRGLSERPHDEQRNMVAPGVPVVEEDSVQPRRLADVDIALFAQLARDRLDQRLAGLNPAARQMPSAHIAVLDQKDAPSVVDHQRAHTQRHAARKPPVEVQHAPQRRLERAAHTIETDPLHTGPLPRLRALLYQ